MTSTTILTAAGRLRLEAEVEELKTLGRRERSERVADARELAATGDEADKSAMVEAQEQQMLLELRIADLERTLAHAETIGTSVAEDGVVRPGCTVTFRDDEGVDAYTLVGPAEANPRAGRISINSPVGSALLGHRVGDEVDVPTPAGSRRLRIQSVD